MRGRGVLDRIVFPMTVLAKKEESLLDRLVCGNDLLLESVKVADVVSVPAAVFLEDLSDDGLPLAPVYVSGLQGPVLSAPVLANAVLKALVWLCQGLHPVADARHEVLVNVFDGAVEARHGVRPFTW